MSIVNLLPCDYEKKQRTKNKEPFKACQANSDILLVVSDAIIIELKARFKCQKSVEKKCKSVVQFSIVESVVLLRQMFYVLMF